MLAAYDFPGNFRAIEAVGARPVLVDIDCETWCLDVQAVEAAASLVAKAEGAGGAGARDESTRQQRPTRHAAGPTPWDEGDCDIAACMRAFAAVGYEGGIDPDHTPGIAGDGEETQLGWAYAVGQLRALRLAVF